MPTEKPTPEESTSVPYNPEPGSVLAEAKWVADEEAFLEEVGATDEEEHQKKLDRLAEDEYKDAYDEYLRDEFRAYNYHKRVELGQVSQQYLDLIGKYEYAGDLANMCYDRER